MTVYENIKRFSKLRGYSLQETAEKAGLSKNIIYGYKHGKSPSLKTLKVIADILGVTTNELLGTEHHEDNKQKQADLADDSTLFTYEGKPIDDEDKEIIRRLLRGK
ncbi:helix-turn-helix domain-containing protein [Ligilactobacillus pobuzihii]|uniref:helix-turn-helix domain-containing protein n=1 Tax=Ligilactobacillus pobuzihii TaxID=449659 RepID=UPI0019D0A426|nr:helix-turn-helix transcriptional regulator [Ligilactobacillus pobuzihii]MBN7275547.1 helix-turn-helix domain-containing protein [Ligilactobacillus pobuzihii]